MTQAARERLELESRLRLALAQGHLQMYYQPQIDIATGRIQGAEALVRWNDPQEGLISPRASFPWPRPRASSVRWGNGWCARSAVRASNGVTPGCPR